MFITKADAVVELIRTVNSSRYLGGEGRDVGYVRTMSSKDQERILQAALLVAMVDEQEQEEPLVRSGKELSRGASTVVHTPFGIDDSHQ